MNDLKSERDNAKKEWEAARAKVISDGVVLGLQEQQLELEQDSVEWKRLQLRINAAERNAEKAERNAEETKIEAKKMYEAAEARLEKYRMSKCCCFILNCLIA